MANLKNAADNGTLITLGLVGVVAAAGAFVKRGSGNMHSVMEDLLDHLNDEGFNFEMMDDYLIVDEVGKISITAESPMDETEDPMLVEVAKRIEDRRGNLVDMKVLGEFAPNDFDGITRVVRKNMSRTRAGAVAKRGAGSMARMSRRRAYEMEAENAARASRLLGLIEKATGKRGFFHDGVGYFSVDLPSEMELVVSVKGDEAQVYVNLHDEDGEQAGRVMLGQTGSEDAEGVLAILRKAPKKYQPRGLFGRS